VPYIQPPLQQDTSIGRREQPRHVEERAQDSIRRQGQPRQTWALDTVSDIRGSHITFGNGHRIVYRTSGAAMERLGERTKDSIGRWGQPHNV
jgi:hypothetical protein